MQDKRERKKVKACMSGFSFVGLSTINSKKKNVRALTFLYISSVCCGSLHFAYAVCPKGYFVNESLLMLSLYCVAQY